jgi:ABC-2 type transport system permease protein
MYTLFKKELGVFFSSLTGVLVIIIFLITTGLFLWVLPGSSNILETGYATLEPLFVIAPWLFLFLIPAVTMRLFTEEKKTGTIELLLTKPISELGIVLAKFYSALAIVFIALLPTITYYISVYLLGNPVGNLDVGGTWGSYIGLLFLVCLYVAIGIFCSALTSNQIVAFLLSVVVSFVLYFVFGAVSLLFSTNGIGYVFSELSIETHYQSISRGVIDLSDVVYFLGLSIAFIFLTRLKLQSRTW